MSEMVEVDIRCVERVVYDQRVKITKAEYDELIEQSSRDMECPHRSLLTDYLNMKEVSDSEGFDDIEISLVA